MRVISAYAHKALFNTIKGFAVCKVKPIGIHTWEVGQQVVLLQEDERGYLTGERLITYAENSTNREQEILVGRRFKHEEQ